MKTLALVLLLFAHGVTMVVSDMDTLDNFYGSNLSLQLNSSSGSTSITQLKDNADEEAIFWGYTRQVEITRTSGNGTISLDIGLNPASYNKPFVFKTGPSTSGFVNMTWLTNDTFTLNQCNTTVSFYF